MTTTAAFFVELASIAVGGIAVAVILVCYWFWRSRDRTALGMLRY
jgi:hypothetical protein